MQRITEKDLQNKIDRINRLLGNKLEPWTRQDDGKLKANPGVWHTSWAYGGVQAEVMCNDGGGVYLPLSTGYGTKRELFNALEAFICGAKFEKMQQKATA